MANEYRNKEWLYNKYQNEELSQAKISRLCGVCCCTIWYWLKKFNIPIRSLSESIHLGNANHCKLSQENIRLTSLTCRQWYIGDGSLIQRKQRTIKPYIILCTCGFLIEDVKWLIKELNNLGFKATKYSQNSIYISSYFIKKFLNYIKDCPVNCYQYKWAI